MLRATSLVPCSPCPHPCPHAASRLCCLTLSHTDSTPSFHARLCQRPPVSRCWARFPLPGLTFPVALPISPRYWWLDVGGPGVMMVAGTCITAPRFPHGLILGCVAGRGLPWLSCAMALEPPTQSPPRDVRLCHPLPHSAFRLPGLSQTLARPLLRDGAGVSGHEPAQPPARSAYGHVPGLGQSLSQRHGCHLCSSREDPGWTPLPARCSGDSLEQVPPEPC